MVQSLPSEQKDSCKRSKYDSERHQWMAEYMLDAAKVKCQGKEPATRVWYRSPQALFWRLNKGAALVPTSAALEPTGAALGRCEMGGGR